MVNYQQYLSNRISDLDKLSTIIPELLTNMTDVKKALGVASTGAIIDILEGFRKNLCELLGRDVHPAECDVYVKLVTQMALSSAIKDITIDILENNKIEELFETKKIIDKLIDKTCTSLGAIIHGFNRDDIKKLFGDSFQEMLSRFGGIQDSNPGEMFDNDYPNM